MHNIFGRIVALLLILCVGLSLNAQRNSSIIPKNNSPFSRLGLGDFVNPHFTAQASMGNLGIALIEDGFVNTANPASLAFLRNASLEAAFNVRNSDWNSEGGLNNNLWSGNIQYLSLAFPLQSPINQAIENRLPDFNWGMNINLQPYTVVGYSVEFQEQGGEFGTYTNTLKGTGGTYQLNWANGFRYKNLAVGLNAAYVFGKITNSRRVSFDSLALNAFATEFLDEFSVNGFQFTGGVQYVFNIDEEATLARNRSLPRRRVIVGATFSNQASFNTNVSRFYNRDNLSLNLGIVDTLVEVNDLKLSGQLPSEYGFAVTYERTNNYRFSAEYRAANWSNYENEVKPDELMDTYHVAVGAEWIPDYDSFKSYWSRLRYRVGGFYATDPRSVNGTQLENYGVTFGLSMPIVSPRQAVSYLHLALEVGQLGGGEILRENYAQVTLGFSLNDNQWFYKRKFN